MLKIFSAVMVSLVLITSSSSFTSAQQNISENVSCSTFLYETISNIIAHSTVDPSIAPFVLNTGKDINDLGFYESCKQSPLNRYVVMKVTLPQTSVRLGLCGPEICSENEYTKAVANNRAKINELVNNTLKLNISAYKVTFDDPGVLKSHFDAWSVAAIMAWGLLVGLVGAGTLTDIILTSFGKKKEEETPTYKIRGAISASEDASVPNSNSTDNLSLAGSANLINTANRTTLRSEEALGQLSESQANSLTAALIASSGDQSPFKKGKRENAIISFLKCFSFTGNAKKVFGSRDGGDINLNVFNGIRVIAICWVIYGHEYNARANNAMNILEVPLTTTSSWAIVVLAGVYAVDVFFYMSGFLFVYIFLNKLEKMRFNAMTYLLTIFHRFYRLWPAYALCILFWWKLMIYFGSGPIWNDFWNVQASSCEGKAWSNLLFVDNFVSTFTTGYCFGWGWYLSNDMQMFLITPLVAYLYFKNKTVGKIVTYGLVSFAIIYGFTISMIYHFRITVPNPAARRDFLSDYFDKFYYVPWARMNVYFYGVLSAFWYRSYVKNEDDTTAYKAFSKIKGSQGLRWGLNVVGLLFMNYCIFAPHRLLKEPDLWGDLQSSLFINFGRFFFVVGLSFLVITAMLDESSWFRKGMTASFFEPWAKIQYLAYLIHPFFINGETFGSDSAYYYSHQNILFSTLTDFVLVFFFAFVLHVMIEQSMVNIEGKYLFPKRPAKKIAAVKEELKV